MTRKLKLTSIFYSPRGHIKINNSISYLPENRIYNYFHLFLKENSYVKKTEVEEHIYIDLENMLKLISPFPACQETGNGFIAYSSRKIVKKGE